MSVDYFMRMYSFKEKFLQRFIGALKWIAAAEMTKKLSKPKISYCLYLEQQHIMILKGTETFLGTALFTASRKVAKFSSHIYTRA